MKNTIPTQLDVSSDVSINYPASDEMARQLNHFFETHPDTAEAYAQTQQELKKVLGNAFKDLGL